MRRIAITGIGLVTPVGNDVESTWAALLAGRSGGAPITQFDASGFPVRIAAEAVKKAGSTDGTKVIAALEGIDNFKIFSGNLKFTPEHTLSEGGFDILVVKGTDFVLNN